MEERSGSQRISVSVNNNVVNIETELSYRNYPNFKQLSKEQFSSLNEAKSKIDSVYRLYDRFLKGYAALAALEGIGVVYGVTRSADDFLRGHEAYYGSDFTHFLGLMGVVFLTAMTTSKTLENRAKKQNTLSALNGVEQAQSGSFRDTYTF